MRKYLKPIVAVLAGLAASWGLQAASVEPLYAKLIGLTVAIAVFAVIWRRSALP